MKHILFAAVLAAAPLAAQADTNAQRLAGELLEVTQSAAMMAQMQTHLSDAIHMGIQEQGVELGAMSAEERAIFDRGMQQLAQVFDDMLDRSHMRPYMIELYSQVFTEDELADQLAFYSSEAGRAVTDKMPQVMAESMAHGQRLMEQAMPRLTEISETMRREFQALKAE